MSIFNAVTSSGSTSSMKEGTFRKAQGSAILAQLVKLRRLSEPPWRKVKWV
jgi:hypothetical protein